MSDPPSETHVVVVWESATDALDRILEDTARRFAVRDVVRVTWTPERFRANLIRLYGTALPPDSDKERQTGTGPFVAIVVDDDAPTTVARHHGRAWVPANAALLAAKRRYRSWSRGRFNVHTSLTAREATKDLALVLGCTAADVPFSWSGTVRERVRDLLGDPEWRDVAELESGLAATVSCAFDRPEGAAAGLRVVTDDVWWARRIAEPATATDESDGETACRPVVAGRPFPIELVDAQADPALARRLPPEPPSRATPRVSDRLARLLGRRS